MTDDTLSGTLIVLSGPSGVGKGTLRHFVEQSLPNLKTSISVTTRPMRPNEQEGVDYFFVSRAVFEGLIATDGLVEWAEFADHLYGTPKAYLDETLAKGDTLMLEIEVQGAQRIKHLYPQAHFVFIAPPSLDVLAQRLTQRGTNNAQDIKTRMHTAQWELEQAKWFDDVIVNDNLETAQKALLSLVQPLMNSAGKAPAS